MLIFLYLVGILDYLHIVCSKFISIELEESLGNLGETCQLRLFINILFTFFFFKKTLWKTHEKPPIAYHKAKQNPKSKGLVVIQAFDEYLIQSKSEKSQVKKTKYHVRISYLWKHSLARPKNIMRYRIPIFSICRNPC